MNALIVLSVGFLILYVIKILSFRYYWQKYPEFLPGVHSAKSRISVVVAFRNEAGNLEALLMSLKKQAYSGSLYEVVCVDDASDDGSDIIVKHFCERNDNFRYINNSGNEPGKKSALRTGIGHAFHEFIVTTDADCVMNEYWLETLNSFYMERQPDMIIGLTNLDSGNGFFEKFEETDFLSLIASGAGSAAAGHPIYCNAANFGFKKSLFCSLDDPLQDSIISGDDTLFLQAAKKTGKKILLLKSARSVVSTSGHNSWRGFFQQRIRWISKSRYFRDRDAVYTALLVLIMNMLLALSLVLLIIDWNIWLFPLIFMAKASADFLLVSVFMRFLGKKLSAVRFLVYSAFYPFVVVPLSLTGLIIGYNWKGRKYKNA
jgi:cellulose synthase/poly-beta-1,6-N-acetylglucosamine synthase-like glycosyltransferase